MVAANEHVAVVRKPATHVGRPAQVVYYLSWHVPLWHDMEISFSKFQLPDLNQEAQTPVHIKFTDEVLSITDEAHVPACAIWSCWRVIPAMCAAVATPCWRVSQLQPFDGMELTREWLDMFTM